MFYDLNVPYSPDDPEVPHTLNFLAECKSFCAHDPNVIDLRGHMRY